MFEDLVAAASLMVEVLALPESQKDNWRVVYEMFRSLEQVVDDAEGALRQLAELKESLEPTESVERCNDAFAALDASSRDMLRRCMSFSVVMDRRLKVDENFRSRMRFYFHPKSSWYVEFTSGYCSGKVSDDGGKISWTTLVPPTEPGTVLDMHASFHDAMCWSVEEEISPGSDLPDAMKKGGVLGERTGSSLPVDCANDPHRMQDRRPVAGSSVAFRDSHPDNACVAGGHFASWLATEMAIVRQVDLSRRADR